jgi:ferredoxin
MMIAYPAGLEVPLVATGSGCAAVYGSRNPVSPSSVARKSGWCGPAPARGVCWMQREVSIVCRMCTEHGEGQKWFLRAQNYSDDLLSDLRRRKYIEHFARGQAAQITRPEPMALFARLPRPLRAVVGPIVSRRLAADHYGQVVTAPEVESILEMVNSVFRLPCVCRRITLRGEHRMCFGFSMVPGGLGAAGLIDSSYWDGPDGSGLERLTKDEASGLLASHRRDGLVQSVWTFRTPYIGGLCNCDPQGCRALLGNLTYGLDVVHPGESLATVSEECSGCGRCVAACPFGALALSGHGAARRAVVDLARCYGCGICESACNSGAIALAERA